MVHVLEYAERRRRDFGSPPRRKRYTLIAVLGRRRWLKAVGAASLTAALPSRTLAAEARLVTLFVCGDVMTGRGIDQILPHPSDPRLHESYIKDARDYVSLAERASAKISAPVGYPYIWGDAIAELDRRKPDVRIVNLETSITTRDEPAPKGINYRMHPGNAGVITAAAIDCCVLANNHVLDWGRAGCTDTIETLRGIGVKTAGAGHDQTEAAAPALMPTPEGRVVVFGLGSVTSGIPPSWAAARARPGVNLLRDLSSSSVTRVQRQVHAVRRQNDIVVASLHWGGNWGYAIPSEQRDFARRLIDEAGVDVVHGHSSHHAKGIEVYRGKPILYGCGDFINDYEGIRGHERYRGDLALMYFPIVDIATRKLVRLEMTLLRMERLRLTRASRRDAQWMRDTLSREGRQLGTTVVLDADGTLRVEPTV